MPLVENVRGGQRVESLLEDAGYGGVGGGGVAPKASDTVSGTVKTNVPETDPFVYTRDSIDAGFYTKTQSDGRFAALVHTHAASSITSGVLSAARLGSGSGGATKFLREDSTWQTIAATAPAGSDTQVQFNDGGAFGASSLLSFSKATGLLQIGTTTNPLSANIATASLVTIQQLGNAFYYGAGVAFLRSRGTEATRTAVGSTDLVGDISWNSWVGSPGAFTEMALVRVQMNAAGTATMKFAVNGQTFVIDPAGAHTLSGSLAVVGNISGTWTGGAIGAAYIGAHVHAGADITTGTVDPARLGSGSSIATKFLRGDSTWQTIAAGAPGGANTQVQFNDGGVFGGHGGLTYDKSTSILTATAITLSGLGTAGIAKIENANGDVLISSTVGTGKLRLTTYVADSYIDNSVDGSLVFRAGVGVATIATMKYTGEIVVGGGVDTGIARNGAGILEINNGTAGSFRDLKVRTVLAGAWQGTAIAAAYLGAHVHSGADITTGTVAAGRLGSGTTDATTFLRGDGAWSSSLAALTLSNNTAPLVLSSVTEAAPTFTTRSTGTRILLRSLVDATNVDTAIGIEANATWFSMRQNSATYSLRFYGGTTLVASLNGVGTFNAVSLTQGGTAVSLVGHVHAAADITSGILSAAVGGTGNGFFAVTGPATATRTFTFPNADATIHYNGMSGATLTSPVLTTPDIGAATGTSLTATGLIKSSGTAGIGYATGAGGTVTQATSKATGVTLNKVCGEITMNGAALASATIVSFVLTNSTIALGDTIVLNHVTTGTRGAYGLQADCGNGTATIYVRNNSAASLSEAIVIRFAVVKAVTA